jgi:hypothetical protein
MGLNAASAKSFRTVVAMLLLLPALFGCSSDQQATSPALKEVQSLPASGGRDFRYFTIGSERFLALAETWNGTTPDVNSRIYRWDGTRFVEFQTILTHWATEWEYFTIGGTSYLVVANNHTVGNFDIDSNIYQWDGSRFVLYQSIPTRGASGWKSFTIGAETFLAVANNGGNYRNYNVDSVIYKWNGTQFVAFQSIPTNAALRWEFFTIGTDSFLAVANYSTDFTTTFNIDSRIYRWDGAKFTEFQAIPTSGAHYWKSFTIGSNRFLAVANLHSGPNRTNLEIDSKIFKWDGTRFAEFQAIRTTGAVSWDFVAFNGNYYLAAASWKNDAGSYQLDSKVYRWNGTNFEEFLTVPGIGASDCAFYTFDNNLYLGVANVGGSSGPNVDSRLYRFEL